MDRSVSYDSIAGEYGKRYERSDYGPVLQLLLDFVEGATSGRILEVGCGTGHWLAELARAGYDVVGLDPSRNMLQAGRTRGLTPSLINGVAEALPWQGGVFERVFCLNSFHHFSDRERFVAEARRLLAPGGGILTVGLDLHSGLDSWWICDYFPQVIDIDKKR